MFSVTERLIFNAQVSYTDERTNERTNERTKRTNQPTNQTNKQHKRVLYDDDAFE